MPRESQEIFQRIAGPLQQPMTEKYNPEDALEDALDRITATGRGKRGEFRVTAEEAPGWLTALRDVKAVMRAVKEAEEKKRGRTKALLQKAGNLVQSLEKHSKEAMMAADMPELTELYENTEPGKIVRVSHRYEEPGLPKIRVDSEARPKAVVEDEGLLPRSLMTPDLPAVQRHFREFKQAPPGTRIILQHGTRIHAESGTPGTSDPETRTGGTGGEEEF